MPRIRTKKVRSAQHLPIVDSDKMPRKLTDLEYNFDETAEDEESSKTDTQYEQNSEIDESDASINMNRMIFDIKFTILEAPQTPAIPAVPVPADNQKKPSTGLTVMTTPSNAVFPTTPTMQTPPTPSTPSLSSMNTKQIEQLLFIASDVFVKPIIKNSRIETTAEQQFDKSYVNKISILIT